MDPLVRATLTVQQLLFRGAALGISFALGVYLVCYATDPPPPSWNVVVAAILVVTAVVHLVRRIKQLSPEAPTRLDVELFSTLTTGAYAVVLHAPGALEGSFYPLVYLVMMLAAGFAKPAATLLTVAYAVLLESGLHLIAFGHADLSGLWPHAALLGVFTFLNGALFRAEIARVRRLSRQRIEGEIQRMKDAARSYRLLAAPSSARREQGVDDRERLLRSSVDEIQHALRFALDLLRRSLGLRTAMLLGMSSNADKLSILELSTDYDAIDPGPFSARDGIFAAALARREVVALCGPRAADHAAYYSLAPDVGAVCATPVDDHGQVRGLLVVDREASTPFSEAEEEVLRAAARFVMRAIENERVFAQLDRAKSEQGKLYRASEALGAAHTEAEVIEAGVSGAREFAAFDFAVVTLFDRQERQHEICAASGLGTEALVGERFTHNAGLVSMVVANRHALPYRGDYDASRQMVFTQRLKPPPMASLLVLPLLVHEKALGTLVLGSSRRGAFGDSVRTALEVLASHVAVSLANARMLKRLEELATTDGLTGLLNKRTLTESARQKLTSASRFEKPVSLLVCDIDHFKHVNDTYGHDIGDLVIKGFAEVCKRVKRDTDLVGRFGGEEFVFVCEETAEQGAVQLAERVRQELAATTFQAELGPLNVTCSVGVATFPRAGETWETLFKATDEALYASKRGGRDRVTAWHPRLSGCAA